MPNGIEEQANGFEEQLLDLQERARKECLDLLDSAWFTTRAGKHLCGELTTVSILPRSEKGRPDFCRIDVICQAAGHLQVEWNRVPLELVDSNTSQVLVRDVLRESGQSAVTIACGTGEIRGLRFRDPIYVEYLLPADAVAVFAGPPVRLPAVQASERLSVVVETVSDQTLQITIRALDLQLRDTTVEVEIRVKQSGALLYAAPVPLEYDNGEEGIWHVRGELLEDASEEELVLRVRPV